VFCSDKLMVKPETGVAYVSVSYNEIVWASNPMGNGDCSRQEMNPPLCDDGNCNIRLSFGFMNRFASSKGGSRVVDSEVW